MGKSPFGATPCGDGDTEGCAGFELRMDVSEEAGDDVVAIANDFFEFGG